ncbi:uracil-DNA glycosylase [Candidatus Photodesmus blepharus]|uniref:Uracil-DNA glycosylase n=1 Tax=Candidatus Photodesmus blepharonis TaxID=1179155 RepID=A0A084CPC8_9GAMM|nr:uracil-DNA glycosylase [Candidatus Photodesmus blepharus]KEY91657.1 uracil-DNA glycosylase [Candidatus Photodesmus blepharus]
MENILAWHDVIGIEKQQGYFKKIMRFIANEQHAGRIIYPQNQDIFNAFRFTKFNEVKVVILGQDPYHKPRQAHGLCFSVPPGEKIPPSLMNIYKELSQDVSHFKTPTHGFLQSWAEKGVLLLNTVLTVERNKAYSHSKIGWEKFTDKVMEALNQNTKGIIFLLWGSHAQKKGRLIDSNKHHILAAPHPSPLSAHRGFFGCRHFSQTNRLLIQQGKQPIDWNL